MNLQTPSRRKENKNIKIFSQDSRKYKNKDFEFLLISLRNRFFFMLLRLLTIFSVVDNINSKDQQTNYKHFITLTAIITCNNIRKVRLSVNSWRKRKEALCIQRNLWARNLKETSNYAFCGFSLLEFYFRILWFNTKGPSNRRFLLCMFLA